MGSSEVQTLASMGARIMAAEFVLVSGEDGGDHGQQLGLFFFR